MKVLELRELSEKESLIHYRKVYSAVASLESRPNHTEESRVEFVVEHGALGNYEITVKLLDDINAPIVPVVKALKAHFRELREEGQLH